jgi:hypothetical protein
LTHIIGNDWQEHGWCQFLQVPMAKARAMRNLAADIPYLAPDPAVPQAPGQDVVELEQPDEEIDDYVPDDTLTQASTTVVPDYPPDGAFPHGPWSYGPHQAPWEQSAPSSPSHTFPDAGMSHSSASASMASEAHQVPTTLEPIKEEPMTRRQRRSGKREAPVTNASTKETVAAREAARKQPAKAANNKRSAPETSESTIQELAERDRDRERQPSVPILPLSRQEQHQLQEDQNQAASVPLPVRSESSTIPYDQPEAQEDVETDEYKCKCSTCST